MAAIRTLTKGARAKGAAAAKKGAQRAKKTAEKAHTRRQPAGALQAG